MDSQYETDRHNLFCISFYQQIAWKGTNYLFAHDVIAVVRNAAGEQEVIFFL